MAIDNARRCFTLQIRALSTVRATEAKLRFAKWACLVGAAVAPISWTHADVGDDSLRMYAVSILHHPRETWTGHGVYLGNGLVITAAHVVGLPLLTRPSVLIAGMDLPAKVLKEGTFKQVDLALLAIDQRKLPISLRMRRMPLCKMPPRPGEPVIVAVPEGTARSHVMSPMLLPPSLRTKFGTVISDVASTGNSGSGVFDARRKCLLGIMSRKIQVRLRNDPHGKRKDLAKYFVPTSMIRAFIPTEIHF
jgi:hypothetical protein